MTVLAPRAPFWFPAPTVRRASVFMIVLHVPFAAGAALFTLTRHPDLSSGQVASVLLAAVAIGLLQLRHSVGVSRGTRPAGWPLTLAALVALVYVLAPAYGLDWVGPGAWFVIGSCAMLLPRRLGLLAVAGQGLGSGAWAGYVVGVDGHASIATVIVWSSYYLIVAVMGGLALYGSARLVDLLGQLEAARNDLARTAVDRERLRLSRDLHDLLGHSLSAVSLKGDLALRLLARDPGAAAGEIDSLTGVARDALRDMRAVVRNEHRVQLRREVEAAKAVLRAAGVATVADIRVRELAPAVDDVLGWAMREAATNVLRHAHASSCAITARFRAGAIQLEIVNDGAAGPPGSGRGLAGLDERARALGGSVSGRYLPGDRFRVCVEIPLDLA
jgi:two-component system sensor histidine kinase DesK